MSMPYESYEYDVPVPVQAPGAVSCVFGARALYAVRLGVAARNPVKEGVLPEFAGDFVQQLRSYLIGEPETFAVEVALPAVSRFRRDVWQACRALAWGQSVTYGQLARQAGYPRAARAVGNCLNANPVPIVIGCHRVLAAGGRAGGFGSGLAWKRFLLGLEGIRLPL